MGEPVRERLACLTSMLSVCLTGGKLCVASISQRFTDNYSYSQELDRPILIALLYYWLIIGLSA